MSQRIGYGGLVAIGAVVPVLLFIRYLLPLPFRFESDLLLAILQIVGTVFACGAGLMAAAVSVFSSTRSMRYFPAVAAGLLAMGVVTAAMAVRPMDGGYLALQVLEQALGGFFVLAGCVGDRFSRAFRSWHLPAVAPLLALACVLAVPKAPWTAPAFLTPTGVYGPTFLLGMNAAAIVFLLAAGHFLWVFHHRKRLSDLVFCYFSLVSGLSNIAWNGLQVWGPHWWLCQAMQAGAYGIVLLYLGALHTVLERSLEQSEHRFGALANASFEGILVLKDGRVSDWNAAFMEISGLSRNSVRGLPLTALLPPEAVAALWEDRQSCVTFLRGDARDVPVEVRSRLHGDTRFVVFRDLSERRLLEREVAETQARLNDLFHYSTDGVAYAELDGKVLQANEAFSTLTGYSRESLAAGVAAMDVLRGGGDAPTPATIGYGREYEREYIRRDGQRICVVQTEFPVRNVDGRVTHVGILVKDVTESRQSTETLRNLNEELTRSNRELDRFAAIVSHDLAEPLRTIATALRLLEKKEGGTLQQDSRRYLTFALTAADRLRGLIRGLLTYSRVQTSGRPLQPVDMNVSLRNVVENVRALLEESGAHVETKTLPMVLAEPELVELLLQNLLVNAVKYRRGCPPEIAVAATPCTEGWRFAVRDNGCGIEPEALEQIFTLFARARTEVPGEGIGLATCKKIVESLGGRIWVESTPNVGSTFYFTLPAPRSETGTDGPLIGKSSPRPDNLVS